MRRHHLNETGALFLQIAPDEGVGAFALWPVFCIMAAVVMEKVAKNLLITGVPGIGKSTLVKKLAEELKPFKPVGFYTDEIRVDGARKGFQLVSLDGRKRNLAHVDMRSRVTVGKYRVNVYGLEKFLNALDLENSGDGLVIIDEIGKMECLSRRFRALIGELLEQDRIVIATVAQSGSEMIENVKQRDDVTLLNLTKHNREDMPGKVLRKVRAIRFR
jgi:nucleoside-triphosphatase